MEVILLTDIEKVGEENEIVTVKNGYARNYLIPKGMAIIANDTNKRSLDERKQQKEALAARMLQEYKVIEEKLNGVVIRVGAKAGTSGKIFGSVTNIQLANAIKEQQDVEIDRRKISIPEEVKTLGVYTAVLDLHPEIDCKVTFEVIAE